MPKLNQHIPAQQPTVHPKIATIDLTEALETLITASNHYFESTAYQLHFGRTPAIVGTRGFAALNSQPQSWNIFSFPTQSPRQQSNLIREVIKIAYPNDDALEMETKDDGLIISNVPTFVLLHSAVYKKLGIRKKRVNKTYARIPCAKCFKEFTPNTFNQIYCSPKCRKEEYMQGRPNTVMRDPSTTLKQAVESLSYTLESEDQETETLPDPVIEGATPPEDQI